MAKVLKYEIEVTVDIVHGWKKTITEWFWPVGKICFNYADGNVNCFTSDDVRLEHKDFRVMEEDIPDGFLEDMKSLIEIRERLDDCGGKILESEKVTCVNSYKCKHSYCGHFFTHSRLIGCSERRCNIINEDVRCVRKQQMEDNNGKDL